VKLGSEELAYQQACRDLERCAIGERIISRKRRKSFERFLHHEDPRIRDLAEKMQAEDQEARRLLQADMELDEIIPIWQIASQSDEDEDFR
jgi:hypothetical protein